MTEFPRYFMKKPVTIRAIRWRGTNLEAVQQFCQDPKLPNTQLFLETPINSENEKEEFPTTAMVWDILHDTWVGVKSGQWVIQGLKGEFYPCDTEVFQESYDEVAPNSHRVSLLNDQSTQLKTA